MAIKLFLPFDLVISFPEICPNEMRKESKRLLSEMTVSSLIMAAKNQNEVKRPTSRWFRIVTVQASGSLKAT